jgi:hypothetical protein
MTVALTSDVNAMYRVRYAVACSRGYSGLWGSGTMGDQMAPGDAPSCERLTNRSGPPTFVRSDATTADS